MTFAKRLATLDAPVVILTGFLTLLGLAILLSATGPIGVQRANDSLFYVKRQLLTGVLPGLCIFCVAAFMDYRRLKSVAFAGLIVSLVLLVLVYLPGIGAIVNGARGWIRVGSWRFQPSEIVKMTFLVYIAAWLANRGKDVSDPHTGLLPFLSALGSVMLLLILQPDTGSMAVIVGTALAMYFLSGAPLTWFIGMVAAGTGTLWLLIRFAPYRAARFMTFLHPELDPLGVGYHINQAILAIGSGGWWGLGYGHSRQKFLYLPEVESDSIFAVMGEELGWMLMIIILSAYLFLIWRCFRIARATTDRFGKYLAAGVGSWLAIQTLLNAGSMTGLLPMTGVTLPFVSHGGSAMTMLLAAMGIVAGIPSRSSRAPTV